MMPPNSYQHKKVTPPSGLTDLPRYLTELLGGFFGRFGYIVTLVWRTGKWILFLLTFVQEDAQNLERISVSAGVRGCQVILSVDALVTCTKAVFAALCRP